ncbi:hypothetical protein PGTUg99_004510 [Puccinia graminis f. sp. tritici]|uniref:Uncharacterized protein n=1 Tax=Puccinia graminis f. sp. tritici TaxID=56615 RepID=A0A5B0M2M0_PUCGR|nr:hypothetical protein PGTUg99_004510 [Puccinia graminis f. sp. tritici]
MPLRARRATIYITVPSLLNRPVFFADLLSFAPSRPGSVWSKKARWPDSGSSLSLSVRQCIFLTSPKETCRSSFIFAGPDPVVHSPKLDIDPALPQGGQWGPPGNTRLRRNVLPFQPPVYKGRLDSSSSTSSPALHPIATSIPSTSEITFRKPLLLFQSFTMVTTRSSKAQASNETPFCPPQATNGAPVICSGFQAVPAGPATSPTELHANKFMVSGPIRPFTPVNSPETKAPIPIHPSSVAPKSSIAGQHVDPSLEQTGINFYPIQGRWSPVFTPSAGNFPPGLRSPDFVNPGSTDGSSASASDSSSSEISDGFSSGSESNSSAPSSGPPSIPHSSAFPSPSSSDMRSVPPSEVFYATRPRPQPVATGSGNSYDDPMVVDDDSASGSDPDSVPFGPTTEWGSTNQTAPPATPVNPDPSAREMMEFDYRAIREQLVGSNPLPFGTQVYREEDLLFLFQHVANNFIHLSNKYPASTLGEIEDRIQFYQNLQWVFTADRQVFLATHCGYP